MTHKVPTFGSRIQVYRGHAKKTSGGLTKSDLMMNKHGRVVSKAKHATAKKEMRLLKHGYGTKKGKFGFVKIGSKSRKSRSRKMRGGMGSLSPADVNQSYSMSGGSGMSQLSNHGDANWAGDGISGAGITDFGNSSTNLQIEAGMAGGASRALQRAKARGAMRSRGRGVAMRGGTGSRSMGGVGSAALQIRAGQGN